MTLSLRPQRGGFLRPFGCGWFIREYLSGRRPYGSPWVDPGRGAPQADIFRHYKEALIRVTAEDRAVRHEETRAKKEKRRISPANMEALTGRYLKRLPYRSKGCRYSSFVKYFSNIQRLGWVEPSGVIERSEFQDNYPPGNPRIFYRLTSLGWSALEHMWSDPRKTLYG